MWVQHNTYLSTIRDVFWRFFIPCTHTQSHNQLTALSILLLSCIKGKLRFISLVTVKYRRYCNLSFCPRYAFCPCYSPPLLQSVFLSPICILPQLHFSVTTVCLSVPDTHSVPATALRYYSLSFCPRHALCYSYSSPLLQSLLLSPICVLSQL